MKGIADKQWNQIVDCLEKLKTEPRPNDSRKLKAKTPCYRIRSGEYRIVYQINDDTKKIRVILVAHRKDVYARLKQVL